MMKISVAKGFIDNEINVQIHTIMERSISARTGKAIRLIASKNKKVIIITNARIGAWKCNFPPF